VVTSRWADLDRPPLRERALRTALTREDDAFVTDLRLVASTGSTNEDAIAAAGSGAAEGLVVVAEEQTGGRGRLDRRWVSPPRAGLTFSVLFRPAVPAHRLTWLPLLAGLAVQQAVQRIGAVETRLKWPNDVLLGADRAKAGGLLAQSAGGAVVVGVGLNVLTRLAELPPGATSLAAEGAECTDRDPVLRAVLRRLGVLYAGWVAVDGDPEASGLRRAYERVCDTLGAELRVLLPDGGTLTGVGTGLDEFGRLLLATADGTSAVSAGDVTHVRKAG
jgi:BirA family transcriptional regulator, biotin operon repressor / biotin---[acetyl-CoA-carboxylase] ligase